MEETDGESLQFRSKTVYKFVPELSNGETQNVFVRLKHSNRLDMFSH